MQATEQLHTHEHDHAHDSLQEWGKVVILLGLAAYFAYNILSGNLTNYINARFAWLSYVAVIIFTALGMASAYSLRQSQRHHHHDLDHDDHTHAHISWPVLGIVAIPLFLGTLIPSQPLGFEAVQGNISLSVASVTAPTALTKDPLTRNVLDWLRVFSQSATPSTFDGEQADVIGFVYREPAFPPDHFMVARFTVSCCVADANAIGLPIYWPEAGEITDGEWVRVQGTFLAGNFQNVKMPILQAQGVEVVQQPAHPYLYP